MQLGAGVLSVDLPASSQTLTAYRWAANRRAANQAVARRDSARGRERLRSGFHGRKDESQPRCKQHDALAQDGAEGGATNCFDAEVFESGRREARLSRLARLDAGEEIIFQPAADAEKSEVMPLLQAEAELAKESQRGLGLFAPANFPAQIEQAICFVARSGAGLTEQLVDYLKGASAAALRWRAMCRLSAGAMKVQHGENSFRV